MFGAHNIISTAICLSGDNRHLRHGGLSKRIEQLGTVLNDSTMLLLHARKEPRNVDKGNNGDIEGVAKADKACGLDG